MNPEMEKQVVQSIYFTTPRASKTIGDGGSTFRHNTRRASEREA